MVREELIKATAEKFGTRLVKKRDKSMESFYLDEIRRGKGFFWVDFKKSGNKGFRVHFQKIRCICNDIRERGYGGYPMIYLNSSTQIPDIIQKLESIIYHFDDRSRK